MSKYQLSLSKVAFVTFASALTTLAAMPAHAQSTTAPANVGVSGDVARLCVLGAPSSANVALGALIDTAGARAGRLRTLTAPAVTLPNSFCNFAGSAVTVSANALTAADTSAVQTGFARAINYTATVSGWTGTATTLATTASAGGATPLATTIGATQAAPRLVDIGVGLSTFAVPSDLLLVAGGYTGNVTITLGPVAVAGAPQ